MRRLLTRAGLVALSAGAMIAAGTAQAGNSDTPRGYGSASCLRGHWVANQAETSRVMRSLVPTGGFEVEGKLYMQFRDGMFQYGSTKMVIRNTIGEAQMTATGRFFTLTRYTARSGRLTLSRGTSTIEWGKMTATKNGKTFTVPGPASKTRATPGGTTIYQCRGATLRVKLPSFSSLGWITLRRG